MQESMIKETEDIKACYRAVHTFFDVFDLPSAREQILKSLLAANSNKIWKGKCPSDLIIFYEEFEFLTDAVKRVAASGCKRQAAIIKTNDGNNAPDFNQFNLYCNKLDEPEHWLYIPKYLSAKEFMNPYKAIKKAAGFLQQRYCTGLFEHITQYALSHDSFIDASLEWDTLKINMMLQKLVEAAYLLLVRTYSKTDNLMYTNEEENKNTTEENQP